jgi:hypothetical protein
LRIEDSLQLAAESFNAILDKMTAPQIAAKVRKYVQTYMADRAQRRRVE